MSLALLRIEHKLDMILHVLKAKDPVLRALVQEGDALARYGSDTCPLCEGPIKLTFDVASESFRRDCECRTPFAVVPGVANVGKPAAKPTSRVLHLQPPEDPVDVDPDLTSTRGTP